MVCCSWMEGFAGLWLFGKGCCRLPLQRCRWEPNAFSHTRLCTRSVSGVNAHGIYITIHSVGLVLYRQHIYYSLMLQSYVGSLTPNCTGMSAVVLAAWTGAELSTVRDPKMGTLRLIFLTFCFSVIICLSQI